MASVIAVVSAGITPYRTLWVGFWQYGDARPVGVGILFPAWSETLPTREDDRLHPTGLGCYALPLQ